MDGKKEKLEVKMCIQAFLRSIKAKAKLWCMNRYTKKIDKEKTTKNDSYS